MKTIGLKIAIGASVGAAISGLSILSSKTSSIKKIVDKLGKKKIDIVASDKNVVKAKKSLDSVDKKLEELKKSKTKLSIAIDKEKLSKIHTHLKRVDDELRDLKDKEENIILKIKTTTDEKELKRLNKSLENTRKKIVNLSNKKVGLNRELLKTKKANEEVNEKLKKTNSLINDLNSKKLKLKDELKEAEQQAQETNKKIKKISSIVESINKSQIKIKAIVANREEFKSKITEMIALGSSVVFPLKTAIDFESSLADVKKVTDFDDAGIKNFSKKIIDLTNNKLPMAREELLSISAEMAQLGIKDKNLLNYTTLTAKMSVAWDMEASDAGEAVGKIKNIFKLNLDGVKKIGDAINHLSNNTSAKASEMIVAMKKVGGVANSFGLSAVKTTALVDTFIALGEEPENAATGINSLLGELNNIGKASKKAKKAFNKLGLSTRYFKNEIKHNASGALTKFLERLKKIPKIDRSAVAMDIFGKDHSPKILKLVDSLGEYKKALKLIDVDSKAFKIDILSSAFTRLSLSPKGAKKAIKDLAASFDELDFGDDSIWEVFKSLKIDEKEFKVKLSKDEDGAIEEFLKSIKGLSEDKQLNITTKLFGAKRAKNILKQLQSVKEYKLKLDISTKSITKTIDKLSNLNYNSAKIKESFKKLGMSSKRFGIDIKKNTDKAFEKLLSHIKKLDKATQKEVIKNLVGADEIKTVGKIIDNYDGYIAKIKEVNKEKNFAGSVNKEYESRIKTTASSLKFLSNSISSIGVNLGTLFLPAINGISSAIQTASNGIGNLIVKFPTLSKYLGGAVGGFIALSVGVATLGFGLSFIKAGIIRAGLAINIFRGGLIASTVATNAKNVALGALGITTNLYNKALMGVKLYLATAKEMAHKGAILAKAGALRAVTVATKAYGVASSLAVGGIKMLGSAVATVGRALLLNPIGLAVTAIAGLAYLIYDNWEGISSWFSEKWDKVKAIFTNAKNSIKNIFSGFSLKEAGGKIISSIGDGIMAKWEGLKQKVSRVTQWIRDFFPHSPAKRGALRDIHRVKLFETVAGGLNEKPLLNAVNSTTTKVRKGLLVGGVGMALSGAVAQTDVSSSANIGHGSSQEIIKEIENISTIKQETTPPSAPTPIINITFGDINIHNDSDEEMIQEKIIRAVQEALKQSRRQQNSIRMYD